MNSVELVRVEKTQNCYTEEDGVEWYPAVGIRTLVREVRGGWFLDVVC